MPRIELITAEQAPLLARPFYAGGDPGPIAAALAQVPELMEVALPFVGRALGPGALDARTKELVILHVSALLGCRYCVAAHTLVALDTGLDHDEVRALRCELPPAQVFHDERERAVLEWCAAVAGAGAVPDEVAEQAEGLLTDAELVELTVVATATMLLNRFCTALDLPSAPETLARLAAEGFATAAGGRLHAVPADEGVEDTSDEDREVAS